MDFGIGEQHEACKQTIFSSSRDDVNKYPAPLDRLFGILKEHTPESVVPTFAFYSTCAAINNKGKIGC